MTGLVIALIVVVGQLVMWVATARTHYRHWPWEEKTDDGDRRLASGFWGFVWPLTLIVYAFGGLFKFIGWATVFPSLAETREKRRRERKERLADLARQIEAAEAELRQVTQGT